MLPLLGSMLIFVAFPASFTEYGAPPPAAMDSSARSESAPAPFEGTPLPIDGSSPEGKWDQAGLQFAAGTAGATIGTLGGGVMGGLAGYVIGEAASNGKDRCEDEEGDGGWCFPASFGSTILGGMIGAGTLGVWTTAQFVRLTAPKSHPSSGVGMGVVGSMLGAMGGFVIVQAASSSTEMSFWPGFAIVMASSSAGAVVLDRYCAVPAKFTLAPWAPRRGMEGAMLGVEF